MIDIAFFYNIVLTVVKILVDLLHEKEVTKLLIVYAEYLVCVQRCLQCHVIIN